MPPHLAGREYEQRIIAGYLDDLVAGAPAPATLVVLGPRGNGKTVLLEWARRAARNRGIKAFSLPSALIDSDEALIRRLSEGSWWEGLLQGISWRGVSLRLGWRGLDAIDRAIARQVRRRPVVLLVDEAHVLEPAVGKRLLQSVQSFRSSGSPVLLILAGTPVLPSSLRGMQVTFWERGRILPLTRLDQPSSADAISVPLEEGNRSITSEALQQVAQESQGYPFFLQLWGEVLWSLVEGTSRTIGIEDVSRARTQFEARRNQFYSLRHAELKSHGLVAAAVALAAAFEDSEELPPADVDRVLQAALDTAGSPSPPESIEEARTALHNLGYVWSPEGLDREVYLSGIPSLMSYVSEVAAH